MGGYCFESLMPATNDVLCLNDHFLRGPLRWSPGCSNGFCTSEHRGRLDSLPGGFLSNTNRFESA